MTTIAYRHKDRQIAVDSRVSCDSLIISDHAIKHIKVGTDYWFIAGALHDHQLLIDIVNGEKAVTNEIEAYGFRVDKSGNVDLCSTDERGNATISPIHYDYAIGSGFEFALAAMDFGKNAPAAIEYAMTRDNATGGKILVFDIGSERLFDHAG